MKIPNPGSDKAVDLGCKCPVLDNGHWQGLGKVFGSDYNAFWVNEDCPIHTGSPEEIRKYIASNAMKRIGL